MIHTAAQNVDMQMNILIAFEVFDRGLRSPEYVFVMWRYCYLAAGAQV